MHLPDQIREALVAHARFTFPSEACGLMAADRDGELRMAYCLTNADESSTRFTVDPAEHFGALRHAEARGWHIAGAFHSHPRSEATPSRADIEGALDPSWIHFIAGPVDRAEVEVRAFRIVSGEASEIGLTAGAESRR
ncbi:MAG: M67 family metallopeptidase [Acidimicrobiia bacterium]